MAGRAMSPISLGCQGRGSPQDLSDRAPIPLTIRLTRYPTAWRLGSSDPPAVVRCVASARVWSRETAGHRLIRPLGDDDDAPQWPGATRVFGRSAPGFGFPLLR